MRSRFNIFWLTIFILLILLALFWRENESYKEAYEFPPVFATTQRVVPNYGAD